MALRKAEFLHTLCLMWIFQKVGGQIFDVMFSMNAEGRWKLQLHAIVAVVLRP